MKTLLLLSICILCLSWASCYRNSFKVIPITTTSTIRTNRKSGVLPTIINKNTQLHALSTDPILKNIQSFTKAIASAITSNPVVRVISNTYSFFYWFPRNNLPYDMPWMLFKNSSVEWLAWYQIPHNLPPYGYLGEGYPEDFFCFGLPGNTLPLGNWDPWGFQLVTKKVVRKYRESELKHGRLAMLATVGMIVQEIDHPLHQTIGGMAITHMEQLASLPLKDSLLFSVLKNFVGTT